MAFVKYTEQQIKEASEVDIVDLLRRRGEKVETAGSEHEWKHGGDTIRIRGGKWFNFYENEGGNAISFVRKFFEKDFIQAMQFLIGDSTGELKQAKPKPQKEKKPFVVPTANKNMRRVYQYLVEKRKIDEEVFSVFANHGLLYETAEYHNAAFVGKDKNGVIKHISLRGTGGNFRGNVESSIPEYSFHWHGKSDRLYIFEAPIDMLSFISMNKEEWQTHSYAACCGIGSKVLDQMLKDNPNIKKVYLCLDNDMKGREYNAIIADRLFEQGIPTKILVPKNKDWNEDILNKNIIREETSDCLIQQQL
ncbi:MAG: DUF3991 and TOPRIM domain-containing protein [Clostridia bacterium]|nr:DUF3991 and TOPRIM domain-containing protein [Clostridia bacterium]